MRLKRDGGISLEMPQRKSPLSRVEWGISWFFSSCGRNLWVPLDLRWGPQRPAHVASEKSSLHMNCEGPFGVPLQSVQVLGPHLELRPQPQGSSKLLTWISRFLWSFHRGVRPHLQWRLASLLSSPAVTVVSGFLSS